LINESLDLRTSLTLQSIGYIETAINEKQDNLIAGENISIIDNVTSSSGGGGGITQADLDLKQDIINDETLSISKIIDLQVELDKKRNKRMRQALLMKSYVRVLLTILKI
jgi:hypothetical protein